MSSVIEKIKIFFGFEEEIDPLTNNEDKNESTKLEPIKQPIIKGFRGTLINSQNAHKFNLAEIKIAEPKIYEDSLTIATYLRENTPVIVNLKHLDNTSSKRLLDFVCGTAYAINGHMMKVGENIFLFSPEHILIVETDDKSTLEQGLEEEKKEMFFKKTGSL